MRSLLNFLLKFNNLIIFIVLEGVSLFLLTNGNNYHNPRFVTGLRGLTTGMPIHNHYGVGVNVEVSESVPSVLVAVGVRVNTKICGIQPIRPSSS